MPLFDFECEKCEGKEERLLKSLEEARREGFYRCQCGGYLHLCLSSGSFQIDADTYVGDGW